jgi:hypothetical protein
MKHLLLFCGLSFLGFSNAAEAAPRPRIAPADTVVGHAQLVRKLEQALCTKLSNDRTTKFADLTTDQAMQLTQQLFTEVMQHDSVAVLAMMEKGAQQNLQPQQIGQLLGRDVVVSLSKTCPASLPLIARLSQTEQAQQAVAAQQPAISEPEKKALQPLATHLCAQLALADAKTPLTKQTPTQRNALFTNLIQKEFITGRPQLLRYYSAAQLADQTRMEEIGQKIAFLMLAQKNCAPYIMLMGADNVSK